MNTNQITTNWKTLIDSQASTPYWKELVNKLEIAYQNNVVYPKKEAIFNAFNFFDIEDTKVVILGQDPYYLPNQANGLAFSVNKGNDLPKSLKNIFKELYTDLGIKRTNGDLSDWASQGVLLLNNILTVTKNLPNSHHDYGWQIFSDFIIKYIDSHCNGVVFILWGNYAKSKKIYLKNPHNFIITSPHPSPLSAYYGFFGSKPFSKTNHFLKSINKTTINW